MSDTTTCPNCSATLPANATFCTSCGTRIGEAAATPASPPPEDATRVDNPGLHDATQVYNPPPPAPPAAAPPGPAPWQPADSPSAPPAGPGAAPWTPPGQAPPAAPAAPPWQQPAPGPAGWGAPGAAPAPPWGAAAPATTSTTATGDGSPLGGIVAIAGGILSLIGLFTAWIGSDGTDETLSGWDLTADDKLFSSSDPYLILGLALGALALGALLFTGVSRKIVRIAAIVVGLALIATPIRDWLSIVDIVEGIPGAKANQEFGFFLTIAGGVLVAAAAFLPTKAKTT